MTFLKGNICRIYFENFLTYNRVEIKPKPHLNIIIGPNGTGKSSVLCGICICLGGKPELTGRGKSLVEYIKIGEDHAKIEIELCNPGKNNYIIRREFSKSSSGGGRSKWYLQGNEVKEDRIKELVAHLGIQISNLCQFLPQDRVIEFAKMDKIERLQSTEKAVGEIELYKQHEILQKFGKNQQEIDTQLTNLRGQLKNENEKNKQLEGQVKHIKERENLDKIILELEQALLFSNYNKSRDSYTNMGKLLAKLVKQKTTIEDKMLPYRNKLNKVQDKIKENNRILSENNGRLKELIRRNQILVNNIMHEEENIAVAKENYESSEESNVREGSEIAKLRQNLAIYEDRIANINENQLIKEIQELTCSISRENCNIEKIRDVNFRWESARKVKLRDIEHCNQELSKIRDLKNRKLQILQSKNRGAYEAAVWLKSNRGNPGLFKGAVHEPLFFLLECSNQDSKYIENVISNQDLIAFVCEDKEDVRTLKLIANKNNWKINILCSPPIDPGTYQPSHPIETLRPFGFEKYLKDAIKAPPAILCYLCRNYRIHNIPIAQKADLNKVPQDIRLYFVGNQRFSIKISRYDQRISTDVSEINAPYFLTQVSNSEDEKRLLCQLEHLKKEEGSFSQQLEQSAKEYASAEKVLNTLRTEKLNKTNEKNKRNDYLNHIDCLRKRIVEREHNRIDLDKERQKKYDSIRDCVKRMVVECQKMSDIEDEMKDLNELCVERSFSLSEFKCKEREISKAMENDEQEIASKSEEIKKVEEEKKQTCTIAKDILNQLLKSLGFNTYNQIPDSVRENLKCKCTTNTIEDLEKEKQEKEIDRSKLIVEDENVLLEYNRRDSLIKSLEGKLEKLEEDLQARVSGIHKVRESWLKKIRLLTSQINEHFSSYMTQLGCAGEVELDTGSNENDFSNYGLLIKVKFRDTEKLKELSAQQQSGGERSVTTALYLLALQQTPTSPVPFRCVDEINQGMDPTNERKMFTMLVESMTQRSASQYFIVSPKLLPNLPYNEYVVFMNLFNWTSSVNIHSLSTQEMLQRILKKKRQKK